MTLSEQELEQVLTQTRHASGPSLASRRRVTEKLRLHLGEGQWPAPPRVPSPKSRTFGRLSFGLGGLAIGLAVGAGVGVNMERPERVLSSVQTRSPSASAGVEHGAPDSRLPPDDFKSRSGRARPAESSAPPAQSTLPASATAKRSRGTRPHALASERSIRASLRSSGQKPPALADPPAIASALPTQDHFRQALLRLQASQRARQRGDAERALRELEQLDSNVPPSVLEEERVMARILALCESSDVEQASALARRAFGNTPRSIYALRLRDTCVTEAPPRELIEEMRRRVRK